jgi:hypothetical protein
MVFALSRLRGSEGTIRRAWEVSHIRCDHLCTQQEAACARAWLIPLYCRHPSSFDELSSPFLIWRSRNLTTSQCPRRKAVCSKFSYIPCSDPSLSLKHEKQNILCPSSLHTFQSFCTRSSWPSWQAFISDTYGGNAPQVYQSSCASLLHKAPVILLRVLLPLPSTARVRARGRYAWSVESSRWELTQRAHKKKSANVVFVQERV